MAAWRLSTTINNYGGGCNYEYPAWVGDAVGAAQGSNPSARALARYRLREIGGVLLRQSPIHQEALDQIGAKHTP